MRPAHLRRVIATTACASSPSFLPQRCSALTTTTRLCNNEENNKNKLSSPSSPPSAELGVGELQGANFRIEPLRREGEDDTTKRARLLYQSRKRGTLESDLLLSTFAATHLPTMSPEEITQYDLFLDENDWDIYYWATQREPSSFTNPSTPDTSDSASSAPAFEEAKADGDTLPPRSPPHGEWAQTVGTFKPAYRPVPERWSGSKILELLRAHVRSKSVDGGDGTGMAFMPPLDSS